MSYVPGARIEKYLGNLNFFLIRETSSLREVGGISSFVQSFICEIYSIVRSHVNALGGNAVVSYFMSEFVVMHSLHKNQVICNLVLLTFLFYLKMTYCLLRKLPLLVVINYWVIYHYFQAQCLIHIGGDAVKVAYIPYQLPVASASVPSSALVMAKA